MTAPTPRATHAVVADPPGEATTLALYGADGALAEVALDPASAVALAADLLAGARVRLGRAADRWPPLVAIEADRDEGGRR